MRVFFRWLTPSPGSAGRRTLRVFLTGLFVATAGLPVFAEDGSAAGGRFPPLQGDISIRLEGRAVLPAGSFRKGPTCGHLIEGAHGVTVPFVGRQPIQGFSDLAGDGEGGFWVLSDNGFGTRRNSPDYVLCIYHVICDFSRGSMEVDEVIELSDPERRADFPLVCEAATYPGTPIPVDGRIQEARLLTGGDFDPESLALAPGGGFWVGEEFGPFLLRFDGRGRLSAPPVPVPGVAAPENPFLEGRTPNQPSSGGFEGMDRSPDGAILYALLEKTTRGDSPGLLRLYRFDAREGRFLEDLPFRRYPLEEAHGHYVGAMAVIDEGTLAVLERDNEEGRNARSKRIYLVDLDSHDEGVLRKRELADLLRIPDPAGLAEGVEGNRGRKIFSMPYITLEGLVRVDRTHLAICNDNNFPFSMGRHLREGFPDDNEIVLLRVDRSR